jgi:hypothetical protein
VINWTLRSAIWALVAALLIGALVGATAPGAQSKVKGPEESDVWASARGTPETGAVPDASAMSAAAAPAVCDVPVSGSAESGLALAASVVVPVSCAPVGVAPEPDEPELAGARVEVTAAGLRFRSGPGTDHTIYGLLYPGDVLYVNGEASWVDSDWLQVIIQSSVTGLPYEMSGYVHRDYVAVQG